MDIKRLAGIGIGILFVTIGLYEIVRMVSLYYEDTEFARSSQSAKGTVIDLKRDDELEDSYTYAPIVKFVTQSGETVQFASSISLGPSAYQIGDTVDVLYDLENPNHNQISGYMNRYLQQ